MIAPQVLAIWWKCLWVLSQTDFAGMMFSSWMLMMFVSSFILGVFFWNSPWVETDFYIFNSLK
jgi:hypothetical protein